MKEGDRVMYNRPHWAWMVSAGRAEPRHDRRSFTGWVLEADEEKATVKWTAGRPWPFVSKLEAGLSGTATHLVENLEVIDA